MKDGNKETRTSKALGKGKRNKDALKVHTVRLYEQDAEMLKTHFENQEITLSQGIRKIIIDYMNKEGI